MIENMLLNYVQSIHYTGYFGHNYTVTYYNLRENPYFSRKKIISYKKKGTNLLIDFS